MAKSLDARDPAPAEQADFTNSDEWRNLTEGERNILQNDFERRLSWNRDRIDEKEVTVEHLQDVARKLGVTNTDLTDIPNLEGSGLVLLVYRIQQQFKSQDEYLNDGMYGPVTEKAIDSRLVAQNERSDMGSTVATALLEDPKSAATLASAHDNEPARERVSSLAAPQNPDVILSLGCGIPHKNRQRAHLAKDLAARFRSALLIASGGMVSQGYKGLGTTEADDQAEIWRQEGVSNPTFLDTRARSTYDNINYNFERIAEIGKRQGRIEVAIVTDSEAHAQRARGNMISAYNRYIKKTKTPEDRFELKVSFYT